MRTDRNFRLSPITIASLMNGDTLILFSISEGDFVKIIDRKRDIIITSGGKI